MSNKTSGPSLHLGTYAKIPVYIHWSFGFIFFYIAFLSYKDGLDLDSFLFQIALVPFIFFCIVLHEYGHALTARKYGVQTKDIIIFPIGGVARLERIPKKPIQEFLMTLAGPMVNIVIAVVLFIAFYFVFGTGLIELGSNIIDLGFNDGFNTFPFYNNVETFTAVIIITNVLLFGFNMIPAFPMDGGRLVRSSLAMKIGHFNATSIATVIGKICAVGFIIFGLYDGQIMLAFIGSFVFYSAHMEGKNNQLLSKLSEIKVGDIANSSFTKIEKAHTLLDVIKPFQNREEMNFLVFEGNEIIGSMPEQYIAHYIKEGISPNTLIGNIMSERFYVFNYEDVLSDVYDVMNEEGIAIVAIKKDDQLIGVADRQLLSKYL